MSFAQGLIPTIETKKIHISSVKKKITVDVAMATPNKSEFINALSSLGLSDKIFLYFVLLTDNSAGLLPGLHDVSKRSAALRHGIRHGMLRDSLTRYSLDYVLQKEEEMYAVTDYSNPEYGEFRTTMEIPLPDLDSPSSVIKESEKIHLICFIHVDYDEGFSNALGSIGGNMVYDLLMEADSSTGALQVPATRKMLYINDPQYISVNRVSGSAQTAIPYSGPSHYHSSDNAHQDGYVGYMAGQIGGPMGPKLEAREVQNYKITSDFLVPTQDISFEEIDHLDSDIHNHGILSNSTLLTEVGHHSTINDASARVREIVRHASVSSNITPDIIDYGSTELASINLITAANTRAASAATLQQSHYGCAIGIDFLKLIKFRSRLGFMMDFHERNGNDDFLTSALYYSNILKIEIKRRRVTNTPYLTNDQDSFCYGKYEQENLEDIEIIMSSDRSTNSIIARDDYSHLLRGRLLEQETFRGHIEEVQILRTILSPDSGAILPQPPKMHHREFLIRDYDLFHNVNDGKYTYVVDITVNDGPQKVVKDMCASLLKANSDLEQLISIAQVPLIDVGSRIEGSYDYVQKSFSREFATKPSNRETILSSISIYNRAHRFITGSPLSGMQMRTLWTNLHLSVCSMEDLLVFKSALLEIFKSVESILESGVQSYDNEALPSQKKNVSNSNYGATNSIQVSSKTGIVVDSFSETDIFADFSPNRSGTDHPVFIPAPDLQSLYDDYSDSDIFVRPRRFGFINFAPFNDNYNPMIHPAASNPNNNLELEGDLTQQSMQLPISVSKSRSKMPSKQSSKTSEIVEISNVKDYEALSPIERNNQNIKINFLTRDREISRHYVGMPDEHFHAATRLHHGGITMGLTREGRQGFRNTFENYTELLEHLAPGLSSNTKKTICESAFRESDQNYFIDYINSIFQEIVLSRDVLGNFYEMLHNRLALESSFDFGSVIRDYEYRFRGHRPSPRPPVLSQDIYESHKQRLHIIDMEGNYTRVKNLRFHEEMNSELEEILSSKMRNIICLKTESLDTSDAVMVNNLMFVEVNR